jgi:hypothetical protein
MLRGTTEAASPLNGFVVVGLAANRVVDASVSKVVAVLTVVGVEESTTGGTRS